MVRSTGPVAGGILSYFARHRTAANLLLVVLVVLGVVSFPNMRAQFFPDVVIDEIDISVRWDGAGAEDVDAGIVQLLEPTLLSVEGVESSASVSREGRASIELEFEPGWDMGRAADDVAAAVDTVTNLPEDAEDPEVRRSVWRDRVTDVVITGPVGAGQLGRFADEFVTRLFAEGVTRTTIRGFAAPETVVEVTSLSLIENDITMPEIASAIAGQAEASPAGDVSGSARVRTGVAKRSADEIANIVLRPEPGGGNLTVGDVASVIVGGPDRDRAYYVGDNPAVSIRIDRSPRGDAIEIQRKVEEVAAEMEVGLPGGTRIDLIRGRAEYISQRLDILLDNGLMGLSLVVALLFLFLNSRTAFWVAAGIPVAMTAALALMYAAGITLNMISLFALIITLGIVVDDAIVVGEHADFRARRLGEDPKTAAERAARRMFLPVFSATITTVIAFFGLVAEKTGRNIRRTARSAAVFGSSPSRRARKSACSPTTIASSTTMPSVMIRAKSEIMLRVMPAAYISASAAVIATGMPAATQNAVRLLRNRNRRATTRLRPIRPLSRSMSRRCEMYSARPLMRSIRVPPGSPTSISAATSSTLRWISMASPRGDRSIRIETAGLSPT